jgi:GTP pyrophosphokinase
MRSIERIEIDHAFNPEDTAKYIKSFMFLMGYATAKHLDQTLLALSIARHFHDGQYRKDGAPYILHPLKVCSTLVSHDIDDDVILAAALCHDVLEDCSDKLPFSGRELITEYGLNPEVLQIVELLSKEPGLNEHELGIYFNKIKENPKALLIKLSDRLHNSSTLYEFTIPKMHKYIKETNDFILPMASYGKRYYPQYRNTFVNLQDNIQSLNHSMQVMPERCEAEMVKKGESDDNEAQNNTI